MSKIRYPLVRPIGKMKSRELVADLAFQTTQGDTWVVFRVKIGKATRYQCLELRRDSDVIQTSLYFKTAQEVRDHWVFLDPGLFGHTT